MTKLDCFHCHFIGHKFCTSAVKMEAILTGLCRKKRFSVTLQPHWRSKAKLDQMLWDGVGLTLITKRMER